MRHLDPPTNAHTLRPLLVLLALGAFLHLFGSRAWRELHAAASLAALVLAGAVVVYGAGWMLHFALLTEPGPGFAWAFLAAPAYRELVFGLFPSWR